jgi:predicted metal-binding membrane protein
MRHDRAVVVAALAVMTALAWCYTLWLAADMDMGGMDMDGFRMIPAGIAIMAPTSAPWSAMELALVFAMWAVMMVGMMMPSTAPMMLLYARVGRQAAGAGKPLAATGWFGGGYLLAWIGFAFLATAAQWMLERASLLTPTMQSASDVLGGLVLITAGLYQWMPLKDACLRHCRAPLQFIQRHGGFRPDALGSVLIGVKHGGYCVLPGLKSRVSFGLATWEWKARRRAKEHAPYRRRCKPWRHRRADRNEIHADRCWTAEKNLY